MHSKTTLFGHCGADMEFHRTQNATVGKIRVATAETWKDRQSGERKEKTTWHTVVVWGALAESLAEFELKGRKVLVEGTLVYRPWDKEVNGQVVKMCSPEIHINRNGIFKVADSRRNEGESPADRGDDHRSGGWEPPDDLEDEIPY